jgi:hypothetical protein
VSRARVLAQYDELQKARAAVRGAMGESALSDPALAPLFRPYGPELDFLSSQKQIALQEMGAIESSLPERQRMHDCLAVTRPMCTACWRYPHERSKRRSR